MDLAKGIGKNGFRGQHERELPSSHGWLALALAAAVASFASLQVLLGSPRRPDRTGYGLTAFGRGAVALDTLRLFLRQLVRAQRAAQQATCAPCKTAGGLDVVTESRDAAWPRSGLEGCVQATPARLSRSAGGAAPAPAQQGTGP